MGGIEAHLSELEGDNVVTKDDAVYMGKLPLVPLEAWLGGAV